MKKTQLLPRSPPADKEGTPHDKGGFDLPKTSHAQEWRLGPIWQRELMNMVLLLALPLQARCHVEWEMGDSPVKIASPSQLIFHVLAS
jgi:hypothetical protein